MPLILYIRNASLILLLWAYVSCAIIFYVLVKTITYVLNVLTIEMGVFFYHYDQNILNYSFMDLLLRIDYTM